MSLCYHVDPDLGREERDSGLVKMVKTTRCGKVKVVKRTGRALLSMKKRKLDVTS